MHNKDLPEVPMGFGVIQLSVQSCPTGSGSWVRPSLAGWSAQPLFLCLASSRMKEIALPVLGLGLKTNWL